MEKPNEKQMTFLKGVAAGIVLTILAKLVLKSFK